MGVGVEITTQLRSGPSNPPGPESARFFTAGITERGPVGAPVKIVSIAQYEQVYGVRTSYSGPMYDAARVFFEEGGAELYPNRVVGAAAVKASLTVKDRTVSSAPDTVQFVARNAGAWANTDVTVQVANGTAPDSVTVTVRLAGVVVEVFSNLGTVAEIVTALSASKYVTAVDKASASTYPTRLPVVTAATALASGADDRGAVNATTVAAALDNSGKGLGPGAVAAPGYTAAQVGAALITHAKANDRVALLAGAVDSTVSDLNTMAVSLTADGEYAGIFAPHLVIPDGSGTRVVSPEAYVAAVRARAQSTEGFWQNPAGARATARFVLGPYTPLDSAGNNALDAVLVNGITTRGDATRLFNYRSLSLNVDQFAYLSSRDTVNAITALVDEVLDPYVHGTVDGRGQFQAQIKGALVGVLQPISNAGGLFPKLAADGSELDPGYSVQVDPTVAGNEIRATIAVRLSPTAALIKVSIVKAALTAGV